MIFFTFLSMIVLYIVCFMTNAITNRFLLRLCLYHMITIFLEVNVNQCKIFSAFLTFGVNVVNVTTYLSVLTIDY